MLDVLEPEREPERPDPGTPLYTQLKDLIRRRIDTGEWLEDHRVPSEKELVEQQGVSRMTANRALRELASEGLVVRIRGKGSFVAPRKRSSMFQTVPNIADEIRFRGGHHAVEIISLQAEVCGPDLAEALESAVGAVVFHTVLVHKEDDLPIQIEDRYVNPEAAPHYLKQNFGSVTPNAYLSAIAPIVKAEQLIEAVSCQAWECRHLAIGRAEPCLLVRRRTWSKTGIVSTVRLIYPGSRYSLATLS